ncbi:MAG: urease accessory protein UreD [Solirubrobacteraceae bacterium]
MTTATGAVLVCVQRRGGRSILTRCSGTSPLAPRVVTGERADWAQVVLVSTVAGPLAGDEVSLQVEVGAGACLHLCSAAATIAHPDGSGNRQPSVQRAHCTVGAGGRLAWRQAELVLVAGAWHQNVVDLELQAGAAALIDEMVIRGRHGEPGGSLAASLRCGLGGRPLLRERVLIEPDDPITDSVVVLGGARVYGSVSLLGLRATSEDPAEQTLARPGCLQRALGGDAVTVRTRLAKARAAYLAALLAPGLPPAGRAQPRTVTPEVVQPGLSAVKHMKAEPNHESASS